MPRRAEIYPNSKIPISVVVRMSMKASRFQAARPGVRACETDMLLCVQVYMFEEALLSFQGQEYLKFTYKKRAD
jgi:hypothetical protein